MAPAPEGPLSPAPSWTSSFWVCLFTLDPGGAGAVLLRLLVERLTPESSIALAGSWLPLPPAGLAREAGAWGLPLWLMPGNPPPPWEGREQAPGGGGLFLELRAAAAHSLSQQQTELNDVTSSRDALTILLLVQSLCTYMTLLILY
ncbi:hypothetical protein GDO81_018946 [Engystomops pustulosus]|uniref:Uncharacterized protein n=1 Tax=Engystomops pustulosus TaxID=76066 RepID=A0AAV6Z2J4_ENGPU|nr:hypothetical protein GDO81_018946 [Engystomops pustulosus]